MSSSSDSGSGPRMSRSRASLTWGVVFVLLGTSFLLDALGVWSVQLSYLFPTLLIVAGVVLTATALNRERT